LTGTGREGQEELFIIILGWVRSGAVVVTHILSWAQRHRQRQHHGTRTLGRLRGSTTWRNASSSSGLMRGGSGVIGI